MLGKLQMDLMVMALACDMTRVGTIKWNSGGGGVGNPRKDRSHKWIPGAEGGWHGVSHTWGGSAEKVTKIESWYNEQLAYMVDKLAAVNEGGRRLLDNMVVCCTNEHGPGTEDWAWSHIARCVPYTLIGSCGGYFKTGRNMGFGDMQKVPCAKAYASYTGGPLMGKSPEGETVNWAEMTNPWSNQLYVSLMNAMGVPGDTFGAEVTKGPEGQVILPSATRGPLANLHP